MAAENVRGKGFVYTNNHTYTVTKTTHVWQKITICSPNSDSIVFQNKYIFIMTSREVLIYLLALEKEKLKDLGMRFS